MTATADSVDRVARRYAQIQALERWIAGVDHEIAAVKDQLATLKAMRERYLTTLLAAARDEAELPLVTELESE